MLDVQLNVVNLDLWIQRVCQKPMIKVHNPLDVRWCASFLFHEIGNGEHDRWSTDVNIIYIQ